MKIAIASEYSVLPLLGKWSKQVKRPYTIIFYMSRFSSKLKSPAHSKPIQIGQNPSCSRGCELLSQLRALPLCILDVLLDRPKVRVRVARVGGKPPLKMTFLLSTRKPPEMKHNQNEEVSYSRPRSTSLDPAQ